MHRRLVLLLSILASLLLAAIVGVAAGPASVQEFGVGLRLGQVVKSTPAGATVGPWYVWNASTCSYQTAKGPHPKVYIAKIRKVVGGPTTLGYLHYGDTDPFGVANSRSFSKAGALAGLKFNRYNLKYPSETEPLVQARNAITRKEPAVLEGNLVPALNQAFFKILEKDGCIPPVGLYNRTPAVPSFGAVWADAGVFQGKWLAQAAKARGWKPSDTALVACTDPSAGEDVNSLFPAAESALKASGYNLPKSNIFHIICKYSATESAQIKLTDWLTAHPNFKHILTNAIDDERTQGEINALKQTDRLKDALTIASGADPLGQKQIRVGDQSASVAYFPEKWGDWAIPMIEDMMAGKPVPYFVGPKLVVITKANIGKYYKG
jgi:ribose transport system substrate-binding protein